MQSLINVLSLLISCLINIRHWIELYSIRKELKLARGYNGRLYTYISRDILNSLDNNIGNVKYCYDTSEGMVNSLRLKYLSEVATAELHKCGVVSNTYIRYTHQ